MKKIYQFTWNYKTYRSTDWANLIEFSDFAFANPKIITKWDLFEVGESDTDIELEKVG